MLEIEKAVREFDEQARAVEALIDSLRDVFDPAPESRVCQVPWDLLGAYIRAIDAKHHIGGWLEWWWAECRLGETPLAAGLPGEAMREIATVDDFVRLVCDDAALAA
jgi:hypothetical protein